MHLRLEELFGGNEWFGIRNMLQLQPVNGMPVLEKINQKSLPTNWDARHLLTYGEIASFYGELTINK